MFVFDLQKLTSLDHIEDVLFVEQQGSCVEVGEDRLESGRGQTLQLNLVTTGLDEGRDIYRWNIVLNFKKNLMIILVKFSGTVQGSLRGVLSFLASHLTSKA